MSVQHHLRNGAQVGKSKKPDFSYHAALQQRLAEDRAKWQLIELRWLLREMTEDEYANFIRFGGIPPRLQQ